MCGMARVRISTTVDGERLEQARRLVDAPDSVLMDRALVALLDRIVARKEVESLQDLPYEEDPDVAWEAPSGPPLPYDGDIPEEIRDLAKKRST